MKPKTDDEIVKETIRLTLNRFDISEVTTEAYIIQAITLAKEAERDKINNRLEHLIEVRADIRSVVKHVQTEVGLKQKHTK